MWRLMRERPSDFFFFFLGGVGVDGVLHLLVCVCVCQAALVPSSSQITFTPQ